MSVADADRTQLNVRVSRSLRTETKSLAALLGLTLEQAVEQALTDWIRLKRAESHSKRRK